MDAAPSAVMFRIKLRLCIEKKIKLDWKQIYSQTVYSSLTVSSNNIGREPITASTEIIGYPYDKKNKKASLLLAPFPYDK